LLWFLVYPGVRRLTPCVSNTLLWFGFAAFLAKLLIAIVTPATGNWHQYLISPITVATRLLSEDIRKNQAESVEGTPGETFNTFLRHEKNLPPKIILMVVESWGETRPALARVARELRGNGLDVVKAGFTVFQGSTLSGEFRELCSKYILPTDGLQDKFSSLDCAPALLSRKGYEVWGVHGYDSDFYARKTFWHRFGLLHRVFRDELNGLERCAGPFNGVCDDALIKKGIELVDANKGLSFLYLLTLSSHEPLASGMLEKRGDHFGSIEVAHPTQVVTRRAISTLVDELKSRKDYPCTLAYVVGDHQPPSASSKHDIFPSNLVPYIAFSYNCNR
jgi:hypothetical protein